MSNEDMDSVMPPFAAPASQHDASLVKLREVATWIDSQCNQQQISPEEFCYPTQFDYDLAQAASELFALAAGIEQSSIAGAAKGGMTNEESPAISTTRPSAALTDERIREIADNIDWSEVQWDYCAQEKFAAAILAASGGAHAVPEGWQPIETAPQHQDILVRGISGMVVAIRGTHGVWEASGVSPTYDMSGIAFEVGDFTHWMALPAAPTTQDQGEGK